MISLTSINSVSTKAKPLVIPIPNTYFTFNTEQTSGTTVTAVISSATMTLSNSLATATTGQKEGTANYYGGDKLYYGLSTNISLPANTGVSVSLWFKSVRNLGTTQSPNSINNMFCVGVGSTVDFFYAQIPNSSTWYIQVYTKGVSTTQYTPYPTGLNILNQVWHHLVLTWTGTTLKGYLDNVLKVTNSSAPLLNTANTYTSLCCNSRTDTRPDGNGFFNIDCLRLYNKVISAAEINLIYNAGI